MRYSQNLSTSNKTNCVVKCLSQFVILHKTLYVHVIEGNCILKGIIDESNLKYILVCIKWNS